MPREGAQPALTAGVFLPSLSPRRSRQPLSPLGSELTPSSEKALFLRQAEMLPAHQNLLSSAFERQPMLCRSLRKTPSRCGPERPQAPSRHGRPRAPSTAQRSLPRRLPPNFYFPSQARPGSVPAGPEGSAAPLTISERPSRQAFWKRACLSSCGRSLKPVYLICGEQGAQSGGANPGDKGAAECTDCAAPRRRLGSRRS